MTSDNKITREAKLAIVAVFFGLIVDGLFYQSISVSLTTLMKDFQINKSMAGLFGTCVLIGMGLGGFLCGWLADRFGRVKTVFWSFIGFTIGNLLILFSQNNVQFSIVCFLTGFGMAGIYNIGTLLVAEYIPSKIRNTVLGTLQAGYSVGYIFAALGASFILVKWGWRVMFAMPLIFAVLSFFLLRGLQEPPSFLDARKQNTGKKENLFREIFADKTSKRTFLLWSIACLTLQFGYYGATAWIPSYVVSDLGVDLHSMGFYVGGTYTAMVIGKILAGKCSDLFGRRKTWVISSIATGIALPVIIHIATPSSVQYLLPIFGLFYGAPYALLSTYLNESFPTKIRGTAVSSVNAIGKGGSMLAPLVIGIIAQNSSIGFGMAFLGIAYIVCGIVPGLFIRERMYDPGAKTAEAA